MKLSAILADLKLNGKFKDAEVNFITDNSVRVCPGCIFVCVKGKHFDGHTKAQEALANGAVAVITERDLGLENQFIVDNSRSAYAKLCAAFYSHPEKKLKIIGITGTNGKTTTAFILKSIFDKMNIKAGMIGTVKNVVGDKEYPASLTTPDPFELYGYFAQMAEAKCEYCVMEVSSQAIDLHRVDGIEFETAVFTNLTQDHLDYHGTIENYKAAKHKLFENSRLAVINADDEAGEYMMTDTPCRNVTYSVASNESDYSAKNIRINAQGVKYEIVSNERIGRVSFAVPGEFSVYNSMGAVVCLVEMGFDFHSVINAVSECRGVPGRMEVVSVDKPYSILIDYAHTPDGLENVLNALRKVAEGKVIAVFGCGGDRDKTKRPIMGKIGTSLADIAIITSDNPRTEEPQSIIDDIAAGIGKHHSSKVILEVDRTKAIEKAMSIAGEGDVILLAGKGHETYQIIGKEKHHYDEREIVSSLL